MLPSDSPFFLTDKLADYLQKRFVWNMKSTVNITSSSETLHCGSFPPLFSLLDPGPVPSLDLSTQMVADCELLAFQAAKAYLNRSKSISLLSISVNY